MTLGAPLLMIAAMLIESLFAWPAWLFRLIRHPVVWMGALTGLLERQLNRPAHDDTTRKLLGVVTLLVVVGMTTGIAVALAIALPENGWGTVVEILVTSSLLATRSLYDHVASVLSPLSSNNVDDARLAVAHIVGRDPSTLGPAAITRASIESLAENASDGVVAPLFWGSIFGLPGVAAYKAINTLDSMIGHRSTRFLAFGWASAKIDDIANWAPARITAVAFLLAGKRRAAVNVVVQDAGLHRSPNAGWPESALAGALGIRLSGPRAYHGRMSDEPWVNGDCPDPTPADLGRALRTYVVAMSLVATALVLIAVARVLG